MASTSEAEDKMYTAGLTLYVSRAKLINALAVAGYKGPLPASKQGLAMILATWVAGGEIDGLQ